MVIWMVVRYVFFSAAALNITFSLLNLYRLLLLFFLRLWFSNEKKTNETKQHNTIFLYIDVQWITPIFAFAHHTYQLYHIIFRVGISQAHQHTSARAMEERVCVYFGFGVFACRALFFVTWTDNG